MLDDAILLIGVHVIKDEAVIKAAKEFCKVDNLNDLELYEAFTPEDLQTLKQTTIENTTLLKKILRHLEMREMKDTNRFREKNQLQQE